MGFARNLRLVGSVHGDSADANQRRHGRLRMQDIECSLGIVMDLSASGMRIRTRLRVPEAGRVFTVTLASLDGPVLVGCRVRWWRKAGVLTKELGIEFVEPTPEIAAELGRLASRAAHNETVRDEVSEGRTRL